MILNHLNGDMVDLIGSVTSGNMWAVLFPFPTFTQQT
jgi:hypothetical protein